MRPALTFATLLTLLPATARAQGSTDVASVPGERALEARLLAPCCWNQTLDAHESPLASELRGEIRDRLRRGDAPGTIERDIVARYGERVRAVPRDSDTRQAVPAGVGVAMLLGVLGLVTLARRWAKRGAAAATAAAAVPATAPAVRDDYDARVDEELARLDDA